MSIPEIVKIFDYISNCLQNNDFVAINNLIVESTNDEIDLLIILAILKGTARLPREQLTGRPALLEVAKKRYSIERPEQSDEILSRLN